MLSGITPKLVSHHCNPKPLMQAFPRICCAVAPLHQLAVRPCIVRTLACLHPCASGVHGMVDGVKGSLAAAAGWGPCAPEHVLFLVMLMMPHTVAS